ncbi:unnamed protein product [Dibothriocephalus latus]|uniref:Uncharacterized protein n=1 Tax=Dibothriocephalus latus TaxID=60516 RepID=A0A3P7KVY8_DIBLA|nr:unnamed protein product [Dibothriocephalus latus]
MNDGFIAENSARVDHWPENFEHLPTFDKQPITPSLCSAAVCPPSPAICSVVRPPFRGQHCRCNAEAA